MGQNADHQLCFTPSYLHWMEDNAGKVEDYINTNIDFWSREYVHKLLFSNPWMGQVIVNDYVENSLDITAHQRKVENFMMKEGNEVTVLSGSRGSGKTHEGVQTVESIAEKTGMINKVYIGAPNAELEAHGWTIIANLDGMQKDDFGIQDEAALFLNSRRSTTTYNVEVIENLPTLRHTGIRGWMIMAQSTKRMDIAILDYANTHIIKNYTDAYSMDVERGKISDELLLEYMMPREDYVIKSPVKSWSFVKTSEFICLKHTPLLSWYTDKLGKAFGRFDNEQQALEFAAVMYTNDDYDATYMKKYMKVRGLDRDKEFWLAFKERVNNLEYVRPRPDVVEEYKTAKPLIGEGTEQQQYYDKLLKEKNNK